MTLRPSISVIVPALDRPDDLRTFVRSLERQTYSPAELIVVDQSDDDRIGRELLDRQDSSPFQIRYVHISERSLTRAKNAGIDRLSPDCDLVAFFDDDIELFETFLEEMVRFFQADPDRTYAAATGKICTDPASGAPGYSLRPLLWMIDTWLCRLFLLPSIGSGRFKANGFPTFYPPSAVTTYAVEVISGGISVFRPEILRQYRFDQNMRSYCYMEDVDIGYRVSRRYKNAFVPTAKAYHRHSRSGRLNAIKTRSQFMQNYCYLFLKNVPKRLLNRAAFAWSILGLLVVALCELRFQFLIGYLLGLCRVISNRYDSLFPGWDVRRPSETGT